MTTPLELGEWQRQLRDFPDPRLAEFLTRGIQKGFRIGFERAKSHTSGRRNLRSSYEHPEVVSRYLAREVEMDRMFPLSPEEVARLPELQISPFGVIPKRGQEGKWRLIVDLSSPSGGSVNGGISPDLCSIAYTSVDVAVKLIQTLGQGALLAKMDLREAYRSVPVHPFDRHLLAVQWQSIIYVDGALPFGLRSAPKLFSALADSLLWIFFKQGVSLAIHYLDDFLFLGPPQEPDCQQSLDKALQFCQQLGVRIAPEKTEGPTTSIIFLGIKMDTESKQLRLPSKKLADLSRTLQTWRRPGRDETPKRSGKKRDLLSLIGKIHHASRVVRPGRALIRGLIDASRSVVPLAHHVSLGAEARADIAWWRFFISKWNGVSMIPQKQPAKTIVSDASGSWGCGAVARAYGSN